MKYHHFDARTIIKMKVKDIKTKFMKIIIFKKTNFFVQDLNENLNTKVIKVKDFNTIFFLIYIYI